MMVAAVIKLLPLVTVNRQLEKWGAPAFGNYCHVAISALEGYDDLAETYWSGLG